MQKGGGEQQRCKGSDLKDHRVDARVRSRPQPAHQHQQQQTTHQEEHLAGMEVRLPDEHEQTNKEEAQAHHAQIQVAAAADLVPAQTNQGLRANVRSTLGHVVRHFIADPAAVDLVRCSTAVAVDQFPSDSQNFISTFDPCYIGSATGHHLAHHEARGFVVEHDAVEGPRSVHIENR